MPGWIGPWELLILLLVILLIFGPKRLPEAGRALGKGMREFKDSITGKDDDEDETVSAATPDEPIELAAVEDDEEHVTTATPRERDTVH